MDDVNMSNLICEEDIIQELELFNIKFEDKEVLSRLKKICLVYDHSAEKLIGEWIGFCSKKEWLTDLNLAKVELFENEKFRQEQIKFENSSEGKETQFKNDKPNIQLDIDMLNDYGIVIADEEMMNSNKEDNVEEINKETDVNQQESIEKINGQINLETNIQPDVQHNNQTNIQANQQVSTTNDHNVQITNGTLNHKLNGTTNGTMNGSTNDLDKKDVQSNYILENRLNESVELGEKQIQNHFGDLMTTQQWINNDKINPHKIQPLNSELHITKAFKTTQIKIHECNDILNEMIDDMFEFIKDKLGDELESSGDSFYVGRVNIDVKNNKDKVLTFESPRSFSQRKLKLDLSKIPTYSLFPGKIICFVGELQSDKIIINKLYDDELFISSFSKQPIKLSSPLNIMVASGPISPTNSDDLSSLEHLLDQVKIFQPHYLILLGPFFDCRNDYLLFNCNGESFFNKIMKFISLSLENIITEAIIVPSTFDLNNYNIFPAPPFEQIFPKIRFMPNPSFLDLNGIVISITSVDIIRHIIRDEVKKSDSNDQERICKHLLTQKNLYPLIPPNQEVNLEYSKLDFIKFNIRPHLFIIPSMIKNFVKNVHGTLFLNPEYLSKGVYSKIRIDVPPKDYTGSIDKFTKIEIVKNKSK